MKIRHPMYLRRPVFNPLNEITSENHEIGIDTNTNTDTDTDTEAESGSGSESDGDHMSTKFNHY